MEVGDMRIRKREWEGGEGKPMNEKESNTRDQESNKEENQYLILQANILTNGTEGALR